MGRKLSKEAPTIEHSTKLSVEQSFGFNWRETQTKEKKTKILLLDEDSKFCHQIKHLGRKQGLNFMFCVNISDFWDLFSHQAAFLLAIVVDYKFTSKIIKAGRSAQFDRIPTLVISNTAKSEKAIAALPFYNPIFIHKKFGAAVLMSSVAAFHQDSKETYILN